MSNYFVCAILTLLIIVFIVSLIESQKEIITEQRYMICSTLVLLSSISALFLLNYWISMSVM